MQVLVCKYIVRFAFCLSIAVIYSTTQLLTSASPVLADSAYSKISAKYDIKFNGFPLGNFELKSNLSRKAYSMIGSTKLSVLEGLLFEWQGTTSSMGRLTSTGPRPKAFSFDFRSSNKSEQLQMQFGKNAVKSVVSQPPVLPSSMRVPVARKHLKNVIDPMSALVVLSAPRGTMSSRSACERSIPVFDGKERFNLKFSYHKMRPVSGFGATGSQQSAYVCRVKYIPISGHSKSNYLAQYLSNSDEIEIWLIPLKKAKMYIPYHVSIPTPYGFATLTAKSFTVDHSLLGRLALAH